jgi:hypothetical protein
MRRVMVAKGRLFQRQKEHQESQKRLQDNLKAMEETYRPPRGKKESACNTNPAESGEPKPQPQGKPGGPGY